MSDAGPDASSQPVAIDRSLQAEARLYEVPYKAYVEMSPRERASVKAVWAKKMRAEAERRGIDPDEFLAMAEDAREEARAANPEKPKKPGRRSPREAGEESAPPRRAAAVADLVDEDLTEGDPEVHSPMDEVPPTESDPRLRTQATLGEVRPYDNEDLVGWASPRNLQDVYARFTIGDGQHFIRVERSEPKVWQQIPCSGYLGEIREPISEPDFGRFYGGRVYMLTVYGPDPKGRKDPATGLPVIKAKTEPFRYTVPVLPPNFMALPGVNPQRQQQGDTRMQNHPFMGMGAGMPTTPADANIFKTSVDFMSEQLRRKDQETHELRQQINSAGAGTTKEVLQVVSDSSKAALEQANKAAEAREKSLQEQLAAEREERRRLEAKVEKLAEQPRGVDPIDGVTRLMTATQPGKTAEEQLSRVLASNKEEMDRLKSTHSEEMQRVRSAHKEETDRLRESHKEAMATLKERGEDELKRMRERSTEAEARSREKIDEIERRLRDREKELRDQMDQQRRDEREAADRRVKETEARYEDRMKDLREQHSRELRMNESNFATRADSSKGAVDLQITNLKEQIARLKEELEEAREEAKENADPVQVMEKAKASAEALGFKKDENEPQTAWERFMATAGMGLGKAFESIDQWLPKALEARGAAQAQVPPGGGRMLPNGAQVPPQQQQRPPQQQQQQRRRVVSWATEGSVPVQGHHPMEPAQAQTAAPPVQAQPAPMAQPSVEQPQQQQQPQAQPQQQAVPASPPPTMQAESGIQAPNALYGLIFPDEIVVQFRAEVERALTAGMPPEEFSRRFVQSFPEPSVALVETHKADDFVEVVKKMPKGNESIITRRDGKKWVEAMWQGIREIHQKLREAHAQQQPQQPQPGAQ